jgi:hypothetical protein
MSDACSPHMIHAMRNLASVMHSLASVSVRMTLRHNARRDNALDYCTRRIVHSCDVPLSVVRDAHNSGSRVIVAHPPHCE